MLLNWKLLISDAGEDQETTGEIQEMKVHPEMLLKTRGEQLSVSCSWQKLLKN